MSEYPWYDIVTGNDLMQGDLIVMTQTCDLVIGREKVEHVLLCEVVECQAIREGHLSTAKGMEDARRGNLPRYHVLERCQLEGLTRDHRIVYFDRVFTLPLDLVRVEAQRSQRLRLLPPYREHLAQSFARYFMRVGLPIDIAPFKT
ncbi:MAG: hypothetical protein H6834_11335 [Planctomycetes bacterium]|nr:hypothetical protein [Planctomycetota bacterium]